MSNIGFEIKGIGKLIKDYQLNVPTYQRPYAWEEKNIKDLFDDISSAISANEEEYFLGTIVLSEQENLDHLEIVDGQQRITSLIIFLSAIKDFFRENNENERANSIEQDFLSNFDMETSEKLPKIKLGNQDEAFFRSFIVDNNQDTQTTKDSHERIKQTKELSKQQVKKLAELSSDLDILLNWISFIKEKLKVVYIIVSSKANAFTIFETLNDRGLELAQVDLLKNYLYSKSGDRISEVQNLWIEMTSQIEVAENENLILEYIKHHWSSQYGLTREKNRELYNDIRSKVKNKSNAVNFVNGLREDADLYLAIINHSNPYWRDYPSKTKEYVETLNFFNLKQFRPLLLAILKKFNDKKEVEKSLKLIVSWLVRNLIIGSLGGGTLEKKYAEKAKEIFEGQISTARALKDSLLSIIPSDDDFKDGFVFAKSGTEKYARYYLRAIENQKKGEMSPELLVNSNPDAVNLEHILPKNPDDNWSEFSEEQRNSLKNRLGNLTLLRTRINSKEGNSSFNNKKEVFQESELWITKMIAKEYDSWTENNITDRQKKLAEIAIEVWSLNLN